VFALLFQAFAVPGAHQHRVLFAGIAGALALRAGFIAAGATMLERLSWAGYLFGALLIVAAVRMARGGEPAGARHGIILRRVMSEVVSLAGRQNRRPEPRTQRISALPPSSPVMPLAR
jgi:predicted tellurium resistance membrane protein TerC